VAAMSRASRAVCRTACLVLGSVAILCACGASSDPSPGQSQGALASPGGRTTTQSCKQSHDECTIGCDASYREAALGGRPLTSAYHQACGDACDAAYQRCTDAGSERPNSLP
jgi:hypothetical protein